MFVDARLKLKPTSRTIEVNLNKDEMDSNEKIGETHMKFISLKTTNNIGNIV